MLIGGIISFSNKNSNIHNFNRIGRCFRFYHRGICVTFITEDDVHEMQVTAQYFSTVIEELPKSIAHLL
jgi:hypothetical protein